MKLVSFDLETPKIEDGNAAPPFVCLSYRYVEAPPEAYTLHEFAHESLSVGNRHARPEFTPEAGLLDRPAGLRWIRSALEDPNVYFINQTIAFDFACVAAEDPSLLPMIYRAYDEARVSCVRVRERLIAIANGTLKHDDDNRAAFDLATLTKTYTDRDRTAVKHGEDAWRLRYGELEGIPITDWPQDAVTYPLGDTEDAIDVFAGQIENAEKIGILAECGFRLVNEPEQAAAAFALELMRVWGMRSDPVLVAILAEHVAARAKRLDELKSEHGLLNAPKFKKGIEQKPTNNKKALQALVMRAYDGAPPMTKGRIDKATGQRKPEPATDKETLLNSGDDLLVEIAEAGDALSGVKNTFLPALVRAVNVPVCPRWQVLVATGRISCWDPNLTNQPRSGHKDKKTGKVDPGVRECWVARPGMLFYNADYNMAELRSLAQVTFTLFGYSAMRDALNDGKELHLLTASTILGITYEECVRRYKAGDKEVADARQLSKAINFGLGGGMGAETFVRTAWKDYRIKLGETHEKAIERAKELKRLWIATYPEMSSYFRYIGEQGEIFELRQHRSGRLRGGLDYCSGANTLFQGLTADGVKAALYLASRECYTGESEAWRGTGKSPLFGTRLNAMIHDELMGEAPEARAHEAAVRLGEVMIYGMGLYTPDVKVVVEPVVMRRWYKDAKPKFGPDGRLVPWEPKAA